MAWIGIEATPEPARIDREVVAAWAIAAALLTVYVAVVIVLGDEIAGGLSGALRPRL